jgi:lysophospholipase L1-like esterase
VFKTLAKNARGYQKGTPLNITMEVQGPVIIAMVNGEKLFAGYDINLTQGTVGLYCRDTCVYDNVNIQANDPSPMVVIAEAPSYSVSPNTNFTVSAVVLNKPTGAKVKFQLDGQASACTNASDAGTPGLFTASCTATGQGTHTLKALLKDSSNITLDSDNNTNVAVGDNYVMVGDSTSVGLDDNTAGDGVSQNGMMISSMGAAAILIDKLAAQIQPSIVHKAATPGDKSSHTATSRTATVTERHDDADTALVLIGINDTNGTLFTPSGLGCSGAACNGTYKGNMKSVVNQLNAAGITPVIARVAPRFGDPFKAPYANPATHTRNLLIRDEYNVVITNQLSGRQVGPDFYDYFLGSENRFYLYATNLHPNALGYYVMAHLWWNYLSGNSTPPFVVNGLCLKLTQGGACVSPLPYKQNLLEVGNTYYVDQSHTLTGSIPSMLNDGRWIMTRHADRNKSNSNYLSFAVPEASTLYVAYDANASSLPGWLSNNFTTTSKFLSTSNSSAPSMRLYRQNGVVGNVTLGGAAATANGAAANYVVIVVKN